MRVRRLISRIVRRVSLLLLVYVLSIGPMFWYWYESMYLGGSELIAKFYFPLLWTCQNDFIRDCVNRYIELWIL